MWFINFMKKIYITLIFLLSNFSFQALSVGDVVSDYDFPIYDQCILINMKGIGSDIAAKAIIDACKSKHINSAKIICFEKDAQIKNNIIYLPNMTEPYSGTNKCNYLGGQIQSKGIIKDGKFDSKWTWWYENGQKGLEKNYKDGNLDGKVIWWYSQIGLDGQVRSESYYKNGKKNGKITTWFKSGMKLSERFFIEDKKDGKWSSWHENGQLSSIKHYKNNKKEGEWTYWNENGQIRAIENYKDDKCVGNNCPD